MRPDQNRVALLTARGVTAIAVIRLSGPGTLEFLARHFTAQPQPSRPVYGRLLDGNRELDDPSSSGTLIDTPPTSVPMAENGWCIQC